MYGKFFASTFTGSMCGAGTEVFAVWGYVIANTVDSQIELNPRLLAALIGCPEDKIIDAIAYLCLPDPHSRSPIAEGRRLVKEGQFAYRVPTFETYRRIANEEQRRDYNRTKKQESRARATKEKVKQDVSNSQAPSAMSAHTEAEAYTEAERSKPLSESKTDSDGFELEPPSKNGNGKPHYGDIIRDEIFPYYVTRCDRHPKAYKLTSLRLKKGVSRLEDALTITENDMDKAKALMKCAIDAIAENPFNMGQNEQKTQYCDWIDHIFKSTERFQKLIG